MNTPSKHDFLHGELDTNYDYLQAKDRKGEALPTPPTENLRLLGRVAQMFTDGQRVQERFDRAAGWLKSWRQKRREDKEDRAYRGSLNEISDTIIPFEEAHEWREPKAAAAPEKQDITPPPTAVEPVLHSPRVLHETPAESASIPEPNHAAEPLPPPQRVRSEPGLYRSINAMRTAEGPGSIDDDMAALMRGAVKRAREKMAHESNPSMRIIRPRTSSENADDHTPHDDLVGSDT